MGIKMKQILAKLGLSVLVIGLLVSPAGAASVTQTVLPSDLNVDSTSWYFYDDVGNTASATEMPGKYEFKNGPAVSPAGVGSIEFNVVGSERWNIATSQLLGTKVSDLSSLKFNTYQPSTNPGNT